MSVDLQSTNRVKISKVRETTFGTTPATPAFKTRRVTSHGMSINPQTVVSQEIRSDRQVTDLILVAMQSGGPSAGEAALQVMDDDLEEALQGTWANNPTITVATLDTEISDVGTAVITVVTALGSAFKTGMLALMSGFTTAANNRVARVTSSTATSITFPAATFVAEGAAIPVGAQIRAIGFAGASADLVATSTGMTSTLLDFTTLGLAVGQWICLAGFATAADNDFVRISAIAAHSMTFDRRPTGWAADSGAGVVVSAYMGDVLTNGSTKRSSTFERQYLDHAAPTYEYLTGQTLDKLTLAINSGAVVTYTEDWMGATGSVSSSRIAGATDTAAPTNDVLNAASNVGRIGFDGSLIVGPNFVQAATIDFTNNLRRQMAVGSLAAVGIGNGEFTVTGTLNTYFGDKTELDKVIANTLTSFDVRIGRTDTNNESYLFDFPSIKLSSGAPTVSGKNADVMLNAGWTAIRDATLGWTCLVQRFWYLP